MRLNISAKRAAATAAVAGIGVLGAAGAAVASVPAPWQLGFQDAASPVMSELNNFHNLLLVIITGITLFVLALLVYVGWRFRSSANPTPSRTSHNTLIEVVWTIVPVLILLVIAVPSFRILYFMDRTEDPEMTLMVNGYQWYWGYEYPDQQVGEYSSYMVPEDEIAEGQERLLSVDNAVVLPVDTNIQVLVSAGDVIHSWALPAFGIKTDAIPGRINETWVRIEREGTYYGMCSEICGTGHGFMPIEIHAVSREAFDEWVIAQTAGNDIDPENPPVLLTTTYEEAVARPQVAELAN